MTHHVVVLAGGLSHEREVSLRSGRRVALALREAGHQVTEADMTSEVIGLLKSLDHPVVFPLLHGGVGEDGSLREVLALLGVPFVGASAAASRLTFDKPIATTIVGRAGVHVPRQIDLPHDVFRELGAKALVDALGEVLGFPMMVKPARSGSALGATKVTDVAGLPAAMVGAYAYGTVAVVEEFIEGTEVAVTLIDRGSGLEALPAVEIRPASGVYDYASRYTAGEVRFVTPAEVDADIATRCAELSLTAATVLGLTDLCRIDIIITPEGEPVFLEANVAPGMTETSLAPLAMEAAGLDVGEVCSALVEAAAARA